MQVLPPETQELLYSRLAGSAAKDRLRQRDAVWCVGCTYPESNMKILGDLRVLLMGLASATGLLGHWRMARNYAFLQRVELRRLDAQGGVQSHKRRFKPLPLNLPLCIPSKTLGVEGLPDFTRGHPPCEAGLCTAKNHLSPFSSLGGPCPTSTVQNAPRTIERRIAHETRAVDPGPRQQEQAEDGKFRLDQFLRNPRNTQDLMRARPCRPECSVPAGSSR
jgi:hypothetical protein